MNRAVATVAAIAASFTISTMVYAQEWNGPNVGIQGGFIGGDSNGDATLVGAPPGGGGGPAPGGGGGPPPAADVAGPVDPAYRLHPDGWLLGAHGGYDWQFGQFVLGLGGEAEGGDVSGTAVHSAAPSFRVHDEMNFDAAILGRLGWSFGRVLVYGTGGAAFGDVLTGYQAPVGSFIGHSDGIRVGWTGGGGLEFAVNPNWSVGAEYRYTDLGRKSFVDTAAGFSDSNEFNFSAVRLRLTYRFAPPPPPPPAAPMPVAAPAAPPIPQARTFLVFFDFDRYNLTPDARRVAEAAAASYKATGSAHIEVAGYTDLAGTQAYNLRLSQRRADAVARALEHDGVPRNVMDVKWFGKEHPRVPTPDGVREPQNRRVEIVMP